MASPPPVARGDDLSAAQARQRAIAARIAAQRARLAQLTSQQRSLSSSIATTNDALREVNADLAVVQKRIDGLSAAVDEAQATYRDLVGQIAELDTQLADIESQEQKKAVELARRKAILADRLREAYRIDRTSLLEVILSAGSFADVATKVGSLIEFGEQDSLLVARIKDDQATLATLHQTVTDTRRETEELRRAAAAQKRDLDGKLAEQTAARKQLASLKAETARRLAEQQRNYAALAKNRAAAQKAIEYSLAAQRSLQRQIAALIARQRFGNIPSRYNGTLRWPMVGSITQEYGCTGFSWEPAYGSCRHFHNGIDIANDLYTPVRAAGDGRVVFAGANPYDSYPKAWIVIVAHSSSLLTWYAHLDNRSHPIPVKAGQWVTKGQVIGYEGMTGRTTGPHLHFMVELNDRFVNPRLFM